MKIARFIKKTLGTHSVRELAIGDGLLEQINKVGKGLEDQTDTALQERAAELRRRARDGVSTDDLLVETFALVREVGGRTLGMRHFDVQILGGVALHRSNIVEMKTGEGKTLAATLPVVLNALSGKGVHVVTVNDYLAARDAEWMGAIYEFMGLSVGVITEEIDPEEQRDERQAAYGADITYVTNHELVFDYLRDNLALTPDEVVLRPLHFAVVDEVDFLLLDEARTPLIISGASGIDPKNCRVARTIAAKLEEGKHFKVEHKTKQVSVLEPGWDAMDQALGVDNLADAEHQHWQHALHNAVLAHGAFKRDVDYIVADGKCYIVDEFTGRVSEDKRFADGLHQALEAKEGLEVRAEDRTLAKTSYQTFFKLYPKLCGMTGTAKSAAEEFGRTYGLRVVVTPTNRPMVRQDWQDAVYASGEEKFDAVVEEIESLQQSGRPVLVGTTSIRESEELSARLKEVGLKHRVLNAKNHEQEAAVIAQAGQPEAVTISTNMAGRGVDILLGGNAEDLIDHADPPLAEQQCRQLEQRCRTDRQRVVKSGGLAVLGTGLHEARRIDDQLRGRAGRQGDPGTSQYYLSLDDPIYQKFGRSLRFPEALEALEKRLEDHPEGEPVDDSYVISTLAELQKKVEIEDEAIRKEVLQYDQVVELQRQTIFGWRNRLLDTDVDAAALLLDELLGDVGEDLVYRHFAGEQAVSHQNYDNLVAEVEGRFDLDPDLEALGPERDWTPANAGARVVDMLLEIRGELEERLGRDLFVEMGRQMLLTTIDQLWTEQLTTLERVDESIGLRSFAELNPLVEYRREAGLLFQDLLREIRLETAAELCALADSEILVEGDGVDLLPSQRREQRRSLKR